jgi:hypothetical protein
MKELFLLQELAEPRLISMPFVTETTRISLIIPVTEPDSKVTSGSDPESVGSVDPYSESGSLQEGKNYPKKAKKRAP